MTETLNGRTIKKSHQALPLWTGPEIKDTYGNKTVLDYQGQPLFAELYTLRVLQAQGFDGVWADTFRGTFRTELPERGEPKIVLPDFIQEQLNSINPDGKMSGTWDLILWKDGQLKFVELKRKGKDSIRQTQIDFLERALQAGVPAECFEIYEWVPAARP